MKSTKFWIAVIGILLAGAAAASFFVLRWKAGGSVARIYQDGVCIKTIDLSRVTESYSFTLKWGEGYNVISVSPGRICVSEADCPDQVCVRQGWIENGVAPIACLPHKLVIELTDADGADSGLDAVTQ